MDCTYRDRDQEAGCFGPACPAHRICASLEPPIGMDGKGGTLMREAIERLAIGILITDHRLRIITCNHSAQRLVSETWPRAQTGNRLFSAYPRLAALVLRQIARGGGPLTLPPSSRFSSAVEAVVVVSDLESQPFCFIYMLVPDRIPACTASALSDLYGLTRAEARVAQALLRTCNVGEVAATLGLSRNTVRTHLRNVWHKTGTGRATELVRRLASSVTARVLCAPPGAAEPVSRTATISQ